jgi:hypothetical protein
MTDDEREATSRREDGDGPDEDDERDATPRREDDDGPDEDDEREATSRREDGDGPDEDEERGTGPRGSMADVSHTPPEHAQSAAPVFSRGGERLGPEAADVSEPEGDEPASDGGPAADDDRPTAGGPDRTPVPDDE